MRIIHLIIIGAFVLHLIGVSWVSAFHLDIYEPRVPPKLLEALQDMDNPYPPSLERIESGREIYFGKGLCVTCHNHNGKGVKLPGHTPRDFTDPKWQEIRTDGEMMWVLRNGSPGTQMPVRVGKVISEEEGWNVIHFIRTFSQAD
ncbi:MAG: cytochrome c [Nitrospina sp.]|jgi:mono/diheme cytochrome c family protein|nr:cytochrome c [Nitrospina sp.]MBT5632494.1 cytochrome c [Nitrospina sp.]